MEDCRLQEETDQLGVRKRVQVGSFLFRASSLPANSSGCLVARFDASLPATVCTKPRRGLVLDRLFRHNGVVTLLMPAQVATITENDHVILRTVTSLTLLAQRLLLCTSRWTSSLVRRLVTGRSELSWFVDLSSRLCNLWQVWNAVLLIIRVRISSKLRHVAI